jgi:DivIVA domain-containing protein
MRGERRLLRIGEYLITRACRRLPAGTRDERYREWAAELPAILRDPDTRLAARRAARMLGHRGPPLPRPPLAPGLPDSRGGCVHRADRGHAHHRHPAGPGPAVTAADVEAAKFGTTRLGGYDEQTVDQALDHYADALARLAPFPPTTAPPPTETAG